MSEKAEIKNNNSQKEVKSQKKVSWKKVCEIISWCFLSVMCVLIMSMFTSLIISRNKKGISMIFCHTLIQISSGSMVSAGFDIGDKVFIQSKNVEEYAVGDYIAFFDYIDPACPNFSVANENRKPIERAKTSKIVFHEIVEIHVDANGERWFRTKGADNVFVDGNVIHENFVIGEHLPCSNSCLAFISFITSIDGVLLFIVLPCSIVLFKDCFVLTSTIFEIVEEKKSKKEKDEN